MHEFILYYILLYIFISTKPEYHHNIYELEIAHSMQGNSHLSNNIMHILPRFHDAEI